VVDKSARIAKSASIGACTVVGKGAQIGEKAIIGPGCFIGDNAVIGAATRLHANVTVYHECRIGARCIAHSGVVIGSDGFGIARDDGVWKKIPQIGRVLIGDDVEIGANTTIDRGALDDTVIEDGVKLDNQIQIAHNVRIGAHTAIAACVGIAGSAKIGRNCALGGASMIYGHITLADGVNVSAGTLIMKSLDQPGTYTGVYPFSSHQRWLKNAAHLRQLDDLVKRVRALEGLAGKTERNKS
jgi:UDP-3-O-[3-hydroxymyristoyl] glucosamine N-acyltransferase